MLSMNCPNFSNESVRNDFNEIITLLGGTQMSIEEFRSPELRNSRLADDFNAMERAYELWDQYNGDMAKIKDNLSQTYIDNIEPTTKIGTTADSLSVFDMLIQKMQKVLPGIQVNWVSKSEVPAEYQNQPAYRIGTDIYFIEENITLDSPMHEFGHLWIDIIELSDQNLYNEIMTGIDEMIANNNPIAIAVKNNGQNLAETALRKEIFSKMMGFTSIGKIRNYAKQNNIQISDTILNRTATFIKNVMRKVSNLISSVFFNNVNVQMTDTVDNVIEKLIDEVIYGTDENTVVKEGVPELFESNPELANKVYEALGFSINNTISEIDIIAKYKGSSKEFHQKSPLQDALEQIIQKTKRLLNAIKIIRHTNENLDELIVDGIYTPNRPLSFTEGWVGKNIFGKNRIYIKTQKGLKALSLGSLQAKEYNLDNKESELILSRSLQYKVITVNNNELGGKDYYMEIVNSSNNQEETNTQITPQQKQQAQQLYSQYLDTIFPNSKVKDIVYHGTRYDFDSFKGLDFDFFFAKSIELSEHVANYSSRGPSNPRIIKALLNANKIWNYEIEGSGQEISSIHFHRLIKEGYDTIINEREIAVLKPEQIHILGSKQDIEGFKEFVSKQEEISYDKHKGMGIFTSSDINEELEIIKNRKETNFNFQPASNISDIKHLILGSEESVFENITDEEFAKNLFTSCVSISSLSGKNQFVYGPIIRELNGTTPDEVIAEIKKDIIPEVKEFDSNFTKKFAKYVIDVSTKNIDPETAGKDLYPKSNINAGYFRKLYDGLNLYDGVVGAYTFDELSNSNNATLKAISTELVSGNYIAIVHKIDGSDVEVTLVDILPSKSNNVIDKYRNKKNVFKNFIKSDAKASSMGVTLKHSSVTARQITNGFVAKSMSINAKKNGVTVKFRGFGTLGRAGSKHAYIQVADINELAENMNVLKEVPEFLAKLNPDTQEVVKSDEDIAAMQSSLEKLVRFLESKKYTTTGRQIQSENDIKTLKTGTPSDKKYIITKLLSKMSIDDKNTQEYKLLSMALAEYHLSQYKNSNRLDDMSFLSSHFMNPHNFQSDLLQIFNKEYSIAKGIVVDASVKWQKSVNPLVQEIIKKRTDYVIRSRIQDMGSKIFEHLYKKVKGVDENGNEIDIIIPGEIHWAKNNGTKEHPSWQFFDQNTKDLYNQGVLDDNDLLYTEMVLDQVEDLFTLLEYEAHKYDKVRDATDGRYVDYSMEDARRYTKATLTRGFVPVMDKTANEMLATGNPGESIKRLYDNVTNPNVIFEDLIERGREMDEVKNVFSSQLDKDTRLANYGIAIKNGQYVVTNKDLYNKMGTNVDRIMAVFTLAENRFAEYSERLVPLRNSINAIFSIYNDMGKDQRFNKEAMEYLSNMLLEQKTVDTKEGKGKFAKIVDSSGVLLTFAHIFMKFTLFFKSVVWNNTRDIIISTSNAVAQNGNYNTLDWLKAQKEVALHANHVYTLARDMQIIDRSEWDMVSNPLLVKSDRNILQTWFGFVPNYLSDSHARIVTMVAQMMRDGTWEAHKFDDETGEWSYDETLDKRMYDENGQITPEGKVLKEAIKADLVDQGLMKKDDNELTRGYDYQDAARLKYLSDKYVIGSYDQNSKSLAAQFSWMRIIMKFRIFSSDRLQNAGLFMEGRRSIAEGKRVVYKDKDGNLVSKREMAEIEGAWQSWRKVARLLISLRNKENTKKVLAEMNPSTKANIARSLIQIVMFYAIQGAILGFGDDDDDKKDKRRRAYLQRQWGWLYSDIMTTNIVYDFYRNPMPVLDNIISFVNASEELVTTGRVNKELMNFVPGTAIWKDYKYIESIFAGEEEYYENKKIEAKEKRKRAKQ